MILRVARIRGTVALLAIVALAGVGFGMRSEDLAVADPSLAAGRAVQLETAAGAADQALAELSELLASALDDARRGAAHTAEGDLPPAPDLVAAAERLEANPATAGAVRRALVMLAGTAASVSPAYPVPELSYSGPELLSIATQLRSTASAATVFVERREATAAVVDALGAALAALDRGEPAIALEHLDEAAVPIALLEEWENRPPLLQYWMKVIGRLLEAARGIAAATIARDPAAVEAAALRYAEAAELARGADNALVLSLSEEGSVVTVTALRRLADVVREAAEARAAIGPLLPHPAS